MENPSLQIGDNNWAAKDGSILGYNIIQDNYLPQPIDFTRASTATRVNAEGLIETASILGSELIVNGDFATDSDWTKASNWTISGGKAVADGSSNGALSQNIAASVIGKKYKISFTISNYNSGDIRVYYGGQFTSYASINGVHSATITATAASATFMTSINIAFNGYIDNVSVKEYTTLNVPRIDYTGGGFGKLLLEPQRTNLALYSEQFDNAYWVKSNATITANSTTSPDGTTNADTYLKTSAVNTVSQVSKGVITTTGIYTFSIFVKDINSENVLLRLDGNGNTSNTTFTFATKTFVSSGANFLSASYQELTNGWFRLMLTGNVTATNWVQTVTLYSNAINSSLYLYGAQAEVGSYATSYIPTTSTAVTRLADAASKTGISSLINDSEGVLYAEISALANDGTFKVISMSDSSTSNVVRFYKNINENQMSIRVTVAGVHQFNVVYTLPDSTANNKMALKYKANDFAFWVNGVEVVTATSGTTFTAGTLTELAFDDGSGATPFYGKVQSLMIFPSALSDTELATLTTL
jgi:Fe-S cluster assembly iron-binding protein IscA